jgi:hypothetical protein
MSNAVIEAIQRLIPANAKRTSKGWICIHCPSCGDKKLRGGIRFTESGGFRYKCFNLGCEFEKTGWELDNGFRGRPRRLFERMGGSISDIPIWMLKSKRTTFSDSTQELEIANDFPAITLPDGSDILWQKPINQNMEDCQKYVLNRGTLFVEYPFVWCPKFPRHVFYPFEYHNKIIGWIARAIDEDNKYRHMKCQDFPRDYMLHQDQAYRNGMVIVQEGVFDAVALHSLCTFGGSISKRQVNFLKQVQASGRKVVLLPDQKDQEWMSYWETAKMNGFHISVPEYPHGKLYRIKDVGDSIRHNGLILTVEAIVAGMTNNYTTAGSKLQLNSIRG